jgi:hypothetical protein
MSDIKTGDGQPFYLDAVPEGAEHMKPTSDEFEQEAAKILETWIHPAILNTMQAKGALKNSIDALCEAHSRSLQAAKIASEHYGRIYELTLVQKALELHQGIEFVNNRIAELTKERDNG